MKNEINKRKKKWKKKRKEEQQQRQYEPMECKLIDKSSVADNNSWRDLVRGNECKRFLTGS